MAYLKVIIYMKPNILYNEYIQWLYTIYIVICKTKVKWIWTNWAEGSFNDLFFFWTILAVQI